MGGRIHVEKEGALGWLIFDHPERRNAVSGEMWSAIPDAIAELAGDDAIRVVLMRGAGEQAFVSGADISEFEKSRTGEQAVASYDLDSARATAALLGLDKPLIAMIHGFCVGGGVAISLTADFRYAADDARFAVPAARLGLGYQTGGLQMLRDLVGPAAAKEIFFTAQRYSAAEALDLGLVNGVFPKAGLEAAVRERAAAIAENAPLTIRSVKLQLRELARSSGERDHEAMQASIRECFESDDYKEGVRAFLEKRRPRFQGR